MRCGRADAGLWLCTVIQHRPTCAKGDPAACAAEGQQALMDGDRARAVTAHGRACTGGVLESCIKEGRLRMESGDLVGAEPPLRRAQAAELRDAYVGLADLYDARGSPLDHRMAQRLHWDALAVDQPDSEFISSYRVGLAPFSNTASLSVAAELRLQPMAFFSRRLAVGAQTSVGPLGAELLGLVGYQHFISEWLILYGDLLAGARPGRRVPARRGRQVGIKLALGPIGHINLGVGSTAGNPLHVSVGVGFNALFLLYALH